MALTEDSKYLQTYAYSEIIWQVKHPYETFHRMHLVWFRALTVFPKDPGSSPITHMAANNSKI